MKKHEILEIMKEPVLKNRAKFLALALILAGESALSLLLPQILSVYIDGIAGGKGAVSFGQRGTQCGWLVPRAVPLYL